MSDITFVLRKGQRARNGAYCYGTIERVIPALREGDPAQVMFHYDGGSSFLMKATDLHPPRIQIVCGTCRGTNVMRDAWADWDIDTQTWVLGNVFDQGHCDDCDGESSLEEVEVDQDGIPVDEDDTIRGDDEPMPVDADD